MVRRIRRLLLAGVVLVGVTAAGVGCRFDTSVGSTSCEECEQDTGSVVDSGDGMAVEPDTESDPADTQPAPDTEMSPRMQPCEYRGKSAGVCGEAQTDPEGECQTPADYEEKETTCDGEDNDCDGETDEMTPSCYPMSAAGSVGVGICKAGNRRCEDGTWSECSGAVTANEEGPANCDDQMDNDCDGKVDGADSDCPNRAAGEKCNNGSECRSGKCLHYGGQANGQFRCAHRIFVTSQNFTGKLGGLDGANAKCNEVAKAAGLKGTWRALVSGYHHDEEVNELIRIRGKVVNMKEKLVAHGKRFLWDAGKDLVHPVVYDEQGHETVESVWTGSGPAGYSADICGGGWDDEGEHDYATVGRSNEADGDWMNDGSEPCERALPLYCIDGQ